MKDKWYGDNGDLVKWSALLHLADRYGAARVLQIAYYRPSSWGRIKVGDDEAVIRPEVLAHFKDVRSAGAIRSRAKIAVFDAPFIDRHAYLASVLQFIADSPKERCVVFLDPDTGLPPGTCKPEHVLESEVGAIWGSLKHGDVLAFYQHQTNRNGQPWIEPKRQQLARAIGVREDQVSVASGLKIAGDVVIFFCQRL
ncbi:MAG TPA: hypothetical protein VMX94_06655 [Armatimonadota bacterium]|nr:hypothetical protein [Armatimonadota bacterium]